MFYNLLTIKSLFKSNLFQILLEKTKDEALKEKGKFRQTKIKNEYLVNNLSLILELLKYSEYSMSLALRKWNTILNSKFISKCNKEKELSF